MLKLITVGELTFADLGKRAAIVMDGVTVEARLSWMWGTHRVNAFSGDEYRNITLKLRGATAEHEIKELPLDYMIQIEREEALRA